MLYRNHAGDKPKVEASANIHPSAVVIGNVHIGEKVFVGPNAVIRADEPCQEGKVEAIVVEAEVNIQDGVLTQEDVRQLRPVAPELTAFAGKVRQTNVFLAEVG
jgi:carbonic anhydrase/acetyltransferase-like protein (isoleucine patch superfamily)